MDPISKKRNQRVPKEVRRLAIPHIQIGTKEAIEIYARLTVTRHGATLLGPGKVRLLELIEESGSISKAAQSLGMSYRRAWVLIQSMTEGWKIPPVVTTIGGQRGGGARLTPLGHDLIRVYRAMEKDLNRCLTAAVNRMRHLTKI